jgi:hypothetical protein
MKPKQKLTNMERVMGDFLNHSTTYYLAGEEKGIITIEGPQGYIDVFLHYQREGIDSRVDYDPSLKHQINKRLNQKRNVANIFYADGETFLRSEKNHLLLRNWKEARMKLTAKEKYILDLQRKCKTERERIDFEDNLIQGYFPTAHPSDILTYFTSQEFGGEIRSYRIQPIFLRYKKATEEDERYDFLNEKLAEQKAIARRAKPSQTDFEFVSLKEKGRLFVFAPKK